MPGCPDAGKEADLRMLFGVGRLYWQPCCESTRFFVSSAPWDEAGKTAPRMSGAALTFAADEVTTEAWPTIGTDSTWAPVRLRKGDLETLAVLRVEDSGAISIAWQSDPKPKGTLAFRLDDLDGDGDSELRVRFMRHETFAFFNDVETLCFRNGAIESE
jgi:hypothetical protein